MTQLPILHLMPRVERDIRQCLDFIGRQPWGKPNDRALGIWRGIEEACRRPESHRIEVQNSDTGIGLRRCRVAQFVVVYAYLASNDPSLPRVVSIRAIRHQRVENVFLGVKEPPAEHSATHSPTAVEKYELRNNRDNGN